MLRWCVIVSWIGDSSPISSFSAPPRLRVKRFVVVSAIILVAVFHGGAVAQARQGTIAIAISVSADSAHVEERYELRTSAPIELRLLTRACAKIENISFERAGLAMTFGESRDGPWVTLRDSTQGESLPFTVRYDVRLAGRGTIPLIHLAAPLARNNAARLGAVTVEVRVPNDSSRVVFPHMTRQAQGQWTARYVGVPSFVEVSGDAVKECDEPADEDGDNGGLVWRFFLLLGIMIAWVPLYLAWARRSGESA